MGVGMGSLLFVGSGLSIGTYSGLTLGQTDLQQLSHYGQEHIAYVEDRVAAVQSSAQVVPAVTSLVGDLESKVACERTVNCVSGSSGSGEGPTFRGLMAELVRAQAVLDQLNGSASALDGGLSSVADLVSGYQSAINGGASTDLRANVEGILTALDGELNALEGTVPTSLVASYAGSLRTPVAVPGSPNGEAQINRLRASYADQLEAVMGAISPASSARPNLPGQSGVTDALSEIGRFLPLAMVLMVVDIVFPLCLWLYCYMILRARVERMEEDSAPQPPTAPALPRDDRRTRNSQKGR